ncbi:uncharacterized protein LOC121856601 [Homarus americanus]|uniref:Uncharacterized protein n=1 Tax=Homarus americanus TaxID=6706 RepID=A0A8J5MK46_HOMAM|nr:uncharacterized protein LOC121856601 [Homarus americanus]KAG7154160.1 hypothetical protein Hamer_G020467 [Homarus americanus]
MTVCDGEVLTMSPSEDGPPKRKDAMSPGMFKRKYLRKIFVPPLPKMTVDQESRVGSSSAGDQEGSVSLSCHPPMTPPAQRHIVRTPADDDVLPGSEASPSVTCKRKEAASPGGIKRKYLRKVVVPPLPQLMINSSPVSDAPAAASRHHQDLIDQSSLDQLDPTTAPEGETVTSSLANSDKEKKAAARREQSKTEYLVQVSLPLLTVNGTCINVDDQAGSPSPFEQGLPDHTGPDHLSLEHTLSLASEGEVSSTSPGAPRKKKRSFSPRMIKKEIARKIGLTTGPKATVRDRSVSPKPRAESSPVHQVPTSNSDESLGAPSRRKEITSPKVLKKKYINRVVAPLLPHLTLNGKSVSQEPMDETPSAFEQELADQENQSPNDPEFVRRASQRWQRKTGAIHHQSFQVASHSGNLDMLLPIQCTKFEWPTSPSQQSAFQRRVSTTQPIHYLPSSPFMSPPTPPTQRASVNSSHFQRGSKQYCSMYTRPTGLEDSPFQRSSKLYSSMFTRVTGLEDLAFQRSSRRQQQRSSSLVPPDTTTGSSNSKSTEKRKSSLQLFLVRRSSSSERPNKTSTKTRPVKLKRPERLALDDSVAEEVRRAARREEPFRRLSVRIRKSLRVPTWSRSSSHNQLLPNSSSCHSGLSALSSASCLISLSTLGSASCHSGLSALSTASCHSGLSALNSASYHSGLSSLWDDSCASSTCSSPSSSFSWTSPPSSPSASRTPPQHITFQDIFDAEPKIAEKFAIMFPTEPRPEWHRHLRHVLHKAGQKIFKKPEYHDTTIPENLRYQLKHIYVY